MTPLQTLLIRSSLTEASLRDRVERSAGAPVVKYPARELLGFTKEDCSTVEALVFDHIAKPLL